MRRVRVIPVLLLRKGGLVKSVRFKDHKYVGDPINAVKIFNEKEIDEIVILDIDATREKRGPNMQQVREIAGEAFIPLAYGGGITTIEQINDLFYLGVEKVILNSSAINNPSLITEAAKLVGSQSVVASVDVRKTWSGNYRVFGINGTKNTGHEPSKFCKQMEETGAGEIFLNSIDRDGTFDGFDTGLVSKVAHAVNVPVVACGGASSMKDFREAINHGASAVAAGSYFVFQRPHKAVLITYPSQDELKREIYSQI
jgi:imidazole glycerol-phosphate synthase subunit HisF